MIIRVVSGVAVACMVIAPMVAYATSVEKIHNAKVVVTEDMLAPGEQGAIAGGRANAIVFMADGNILVGRAGTRRVTRMVHPGEVISFSDRMSAIQNLGKMPLHFTRIEFLTHGSDGRWGMTGLPPNYKMLHEDRYARSYEIKIPAGKFEPQHTHHARVVVTLQGADLEHILPDGKKQPSTLKTGEIAWREGATHVGHNIGKTDLWVIAVEPK